MHGFPFPHLPTAGRAIRLDGARLSHLVSGPDFKSGPDGPKQSGLQPLRPFLKGHGFQPPPSDGCSLRSDAEQQQCLVVLLHAVPFDFAHDQLP
jgi:hypothetical protein